ncbi:hypothetical protein EB796_020007 [Bugula neritina]|uniref:Uncharacterized protein n=1 Tax=Bugula neritina TaxID=10212 RepID=A0A7J7J8K0_BUGNE|nr:hypothetical protein EB796_020007 [Bugula neritina]
MITMPETYLMTKSSLRNEHVIAVRMGDTLYQQSLGILATGCPQNLQEIEKNCRNLCIKVKPLLDESCNTRCSVTHSVKEVQDSEAIIEAMMSQLKDRDNLMTGINQYATKQNPTENSAELATPTLFILIGLKCVI